MRTLRYYDRVGLLSPSHHTHTGYRLYTEQDLVTLQRILDLKFLGLSLDEIRLCLHTRPDRLPQAIARQKAVLQEQRDRLDGILQAIDEMEAKLLQGEWDWDLFAQVIQAKRPMANQATLGDILRRLEDRLTRDNRQHLVPLIAEEPVREGIIVAQAAYDPGARGDHYYRSVIQPLLQQITEIGLWPENADLDAYYESTPEGGITYHGLGLSLEIATPDQEFRGFSLPVLDLWYGRWV